MCPDRTDRCCSIDCALAQPRMVLRDYSPTSIRSARCSSHLYGLVEYFSEQGGELLLMRRSRSRLPTRSVRRRQLQDWVYLLQICHSRYNTWDRPPLSYFLRDSRRGVG